MEKTAIAFCPGHISGWFKQVTDDKGRPASIGGGIVINEGVIAEASQSDDIEIVATTIDKSGNIVSEMYESPPIEAAMRALGVTARVNTRTCLPMGAGFGLSAASLLASIKAVSELRELKLDDNSIGTLAHFTEVAFQTGLGDVAACMKGGYICRKTPGINGEITRRYDMNKPIAAVSFGPLPTKKILNNPEIMGSIISAYSDEKPVSPDSFFKIARAFAEDSKLISARSREVLEECDLRNIPASITMLGDGVFAYGEKAVSVLSNFGDVYMLKMSHDGFAYHNSRDE